MPQSILQHLIAPLLYRPLYAQVAIGAVAAVEKLGGELGGLIATWPTTVIPTMMAIRCPARPRAFTRLRFVKHSLLDARLNSSSQEQFRNSACTSGHAPGIRTCAVGAFTSSCPFFTWCHMISPCAHDLSIRSVTLFSFSACVSQMTNTTTLLVWKVPPARFFQPQNNSCAFCSFSNRILVSVSSGSPAPTLVQTLPSVSECNPPSLTSPASGPFIAPSPSSPSHHVCCGL